MNKDILESSTEEKVRNLFNTYIDKLPYALSKETEPRVLNGLFIESTQKNRVDIRKLVTARMDVLGIGYDKSIIF